MTPVEAVTDPWIPSKVSDREWAMLSARAPQLTATMRRYLLQLTTFLAPASVIVADHTLRQFAGWLTEHTTITAVADTARRDIEDYKVGLAGRPGTKAPTLAKNTQRQRLRMIRVFFERRRRWSPPTPTTDSIARYRTALDTLDRALRIYRHPQRTGCGDTTPSRNPVACACDGGRRIRVSRTSLGGGPIICQVCGSQFDPQ